MRCVCIYVFIHLEASPQSLLIEEPGGDIQQQHEVEQLTPLH